MKKLIFVLAFCFVWSGLESQTLSVRSTFTKAATSTVYSANDVGSATGGALIEFAGMAKNLGGSGLIVGAILDTDTVNVANATFDLYLFADTTSITAIADNGVYTMLSGNNGKRIAKISFSLSTGGTGSTAAISDVNGFLTSYRCATYSKSLFGMLVTTGAYQGKLSGVFGVTLKYLRD